MKNSEILTIQDMKDFKNHCSEKEYTENFFNSLKETNIKIVVKESMPSKINDNEIAENYDILVDYLPKNHEKIKTINGYEIKDFDLKNMKFEEEN